MGLFQPHPPPTVLLTVHLWELEGPWCIDTVYLSVRKLCQVLLENNRESVSFLGNREMLDLQQTQLLPRVTSQDCRGDLIGVGRVVNPKDIIGPQGVGSPI